MKTKPLFELRDIESEQHLRWDRDLGVYLTQNKTEEYVGINIPVAWLALAQQTGLLGGYVGVVLWHLSKLRGEPFAVSRRDWQRFGLLWRSATRAVYKLEQAHLVSTTTQPGQSRRVTLIKPPNQRRTDTALTGKMGLSGRADKC